MADFWSFSIAGFFLPLILRAKGVATKQSTADTYRSYIWICMLYLRLVRPLLTQNSLARCHRDYPWSCGRLLVMRMTDQCRYSSWRHLVLAESGEWSPPPP
jgi:hypothetical protein